MDELNKEVVMEPNANISDAARQFVGVTQLEEGQVYHLPGFKGMGVVISGEESPAMIQPIHFFTEGNRRYAVGPLLKKG